MAESAESQHQRLVYSTPSVPVASYNTNPHGHFLFAVQVATIWACWQDILWNLPCDIENLPTPVVPVIVYSCSCSCDADLQLRPLYWSAGHVRQLLCKSLMHCTSYFPSLPLPLRLPLPLSLPLLHPLHFAAAFALCLLLAMLWLQQGCRLRRFPSQLQEAYPIRAFLAARQQAI